MAVGCRASVRPGSPTKSRSSIESLWIQHKLDKIRINGLVDSTEAGAFGATGLDLCPDPHRSLFGRFSSREISTARTFGSKPLDSPGIRETKPEVRVSPTSWECGSVGIAGHGPSRDRWPQYPPPPLLSSSVQRLSRSPSLAKDR